MRLHNTAEHAIRTMVQVASQPPDQIKQISEISSKQDVPESILRKIIASLLKHGLIYFSRENGEGVVLKRPVNEITILDIIEAIEGEIYLNECLVGPDYCDRIPQCPVHLVWQEIRDATNDITREKTIEKLVYKSINYCQYHVSLSALK